MNYVPRDGGNWLANDQSHNVTEWQVHFKTYYHSHTQISSPKTTAKLVFLNLS